MGENIIKINNGKDYLQYREGSGGTVEIFNIVVYSERRKGNGRKLVELLKERVDTHLIFAITRDSNLNAHLFYEGMGFKLIAHMPGFYEDEPARLYGLKNEKVSKT